MKSLLPPLFNKKMNKAQERDLEFLISCLSALNVPKALIADLSEQHLLPILRTGKIKTIEKKLQDIQKLEEGTCAYLPAKMIASLYRLGISKESPELITPCREALFLLAEAGDLHAQSTLHRNHNDDPEATVKEDVLSALRKGINRFNLDSRRISRLSPLLYEIAKIKEAGNRETVDAIAMLATTDNHREGAYALYTLASLCPLYRAEAERTLSIMYSKMGNAFANQMLQQLLHESSSHMESETTLELVELLRKAHVWGSEHQHDHPKTESYPQYHAILKMGTDLLTDEGCNALDRMAARVFDVDPVLEDFLHHFWAPIEFPRK